jgi:hypothetical protein
LLALLDPGLVQRRPRSRQKAQSGTYGSAVRQDATVPEDSKARQLARERIAALRSESYEVLVSEYLNRSVHNEVEVATGSHYDVEVQAFWDTVRQPGNLRVMVGVDSKRKSFRKLTTEDFILPPDGTFVGERSSSTNFPDGLLRQGGAQ